MLRSVLGCVNQEFRSSLVQPSFLFSRQFSSTPIAGFRVVKSTKRILSKKQALAKSKRREAAKPKSAYFYEKLPLVDAIAVLRAVEVAKPNATYELLIRTMLGPGIPTPKGRVNLPKEPKPRPKDVIVVFADGKLAEDAIKNGATHVGGSELIEPIATNQIRATTILCAPAFLRTITPRLARILGPLGMMPSIRRGTVTEDIQGYLKSLNASAEWRADKTGTIRLPIAKMSYTPAEVKTNVDTFMASVKKATNNDTGGNKKRDENKPVALLKTVLLSSSNGPSIQIEGY